MNNNKLVNAHLRGAEKPVRLVGSPVSREGAATGGSSGDCESCGSNWPALSGRRRVHRQRSEPLAPSSRPGSAMGGECISSTASAGGGASI